jgi:hypothetical protein
MPYLIAAVVLVGLLCTVDLILTFAVIRRLREQAVRLSEIPPSPPRFLSAGSQLPEFAAASTAGDVLTRDFFAGPTLVGLFTTNCEACHKQLPVFLAEIEDRRYPPERVFALVASAGGDPAEVLAQLDGRATVLTEEVGGVVTQAFSVLGFPSFYIVDRGGVIVGGAGSVRDLPIAAAV